ncbi:MAG: DegT/DnrJ/EryC1/StrS family aminotransferase, partial [Chloroflexi bacterium]|nr:DegT/DnrJ/EryC1/StrS family aminotransferase [Chloroflexota bacterium]
FTEVLPDTLNLDPEDVEARITPRTRAILTVDYAGQPCDYEAIHAIALQHGLVVIEDAAQGLGAIYQGQRVGSFSPLTTFSFHPVKSITTGEGGMVTTGDPHLAQRMRAFRNHGITTDARQRGSWVYEMADLGYNYRLSDLQCALGLSQLTKLDRWLARRREIAARYASALAHLEEVQLPQILFDVESAWHLYVIQLRLEMLRVGREQVFQALRAENIGVNVHYIPVYWHPYYHGLGYRRGLCPVTESVYERLLTLPIWPGMTDEDVDDVVEAMTKVLRAYRR